MDATLEQAVSTPWFAVLLGLFACVALLLAMAGVRRGLVYRVSANERAGLRMALGAQPLAIVWLTLRSGLRFTIVSVAVGWIASLALARVLASMLFSTSTRDPLIFVAVPLALVAVACLAGSAGDQARAGGSSRGPEI
jgi:hypothetical protein